MLGKIEAIKTHSIVHTDLRTAPLPDLAGIKVSPNTATSVGLTLERIERMPPPYPSRCAAGWETTNFTVAPTKSYSFEVY